MRQTGRARQRARAIAAGAAVLAGACKKDPPPPAPPPPEVAVVQVEPRRVPTAYDFTGEVQPYRRVEVRARVDGRDRVPPVHRGRHGQAGTGALPHRPGAAGCRLPERPGPRTRTPSGRSQRLEPLLGQNAVAQQDVDNARADMEAAEGDLAEAKKNLDDAVVRAEIERPGRPDQYRGGRAG